MNILFFILAASYLHTYHIKCDTVNYVNYPDKEVHIQLDCSSLIPYRKLNIENLAKNAIPIERDLNDFYTNLIYDLDQELKKDNSSFWSFFSHNKYFYSGKIKVHKDISTCIILVQTPSFEEAYMLNIDKENFLTSKISIADKELFSIIHFTKRNSKKDFTYIGLPNPSHDNNVYSKSSFSIDKDGFCHVIKE
jgi:hypothetical protein